ncbi:receptor-type tyrosine-protein phosphatase beta-like isoform X3 [Echeneis naucrates]|uniref:receptor-type tyrosine-protein phosphatase beta-like isoform X3 n=1 Tax=Echeneis naucrates TaxID=173247 RepID=UPI001113B822|nr:receptor-type tyrosine-protein phosphatase beta-like isoform X3 [Echeneis naucrates]
MKPLSVCLWTLAVFLAVLKESHAECAEVSCYSVGLEIFTTTTTVSVVPSPNCNISIGGETFENSSQTGLTPGTVYEISIGCRNCCANATLKPKQVRNLTVTNVSTSSLSVNWTEPEGNSSFYKVQWTNGNLSKNATEFKTSFNISDLTAGVQYEINVTAVATDNRTDGQSSSILQYTKPGMILTHTNVSQTTSSISLMWTRPPGEVFMYRLEWDSGGDLMTTYTDDTSAVLSYLIPGTTYTITVRAVAGDNKTEGDPYSLISATKPKQVRNLTVTNVSTSSLSVNWTEPEGNSSFYKVQWTNGNLSKNATEFKTSFNISDLTAGVQYEINVTAVATDNRTDGQSSSILQYTKPEVVGNLSVTNVTTSSVTVMWSQPNGERYFYRVQLSNGTTNWTHDVYETNINITELTAGVNYSFTVTAVAGDNKTQSEMATVSTYTKPGMILTHTNVSQTTSSISLMWTRPPGEVFMYRLEWDSGGDLMTTYTDDTSAVLSYLIPGTTYTITVRAVAGDNKTEGDPYSLISATKPKQVRNLTVTNVSTSSLSVNWTEPEGNSSFYKVQWTNGNLSKNATEFKTSFNISDLTAGVQYEINVTAVATDNRTDGQSSSILQYTKPEVVGNLSVTNVTTSSVTVMWSQPNGERYFYRVQLSNGTTNWTHDVYETNINITELTAGVNYSFTVTAVAGDNKTQSEMATVSTYTKPGMILTHTNVSQTTSSISLMWTRPPGEVFMYRLEWDSGGDLMTTYTDDTSAVLSYLIPGTTYTITVRAVAGDNKTEGDPYSLISATKPKQVRNLTVTNVSTSSLSVNWTEPEGNSSFYKVQWTNGNLSKNATEFKTSFNISDLTAGVQYEINVTAVATDNRTDGQSSSILQYTKPGMILTHTNVSQTTSSISLMWTRPPGEVFMYRLEWDSGGDLMTTYTDDTSAVLSYLIPGTTYTITVRAVAGDNKTEGDPYSLISATKPKQVRNLTVTNVSTSSLSVNWTEPEGNSSFYKVQWTNGNLSKNATEFKTSFNISDLTAGVQYEINVTAVATDNRTDGQSSSILQYTKPGMILTHTNVSQTTSSISLMWTRPPGEVFMYRLEWDSGGDLMTTYTDDTSAVLSYLIPGTTYTITVRAVAGDNKTEGDPYSLISATKPKQVRNLTVTNVSTSSLSVNWTEPEGNSSFYKVQWTNGNLSKNATEFKTSFNISDLTAGVQYEINVTAVATDNRTDGQSSSILQYTKPEVVGNLSVTNVTTSSVTVMWSQPNGERYFYRVQLSNGTTNWTHDVYETNINITELTAGVNYSFTVTAVAGDNKTQSEMATVSTYTKPGMILTHTNVSQTTSSISLMWTRPPGEVFMYRLEWDSGGDLMTTYTDDTSAVLSYLIPGTTYTITVRAVAGDNKTEGDPYSLISATKPESVGVISFTSVTTSSLTLNWTVPEGKVSFYRVQWRSTSFSNNTNVTEPPFTIENLTAGVNYSITISSVADDGQTEGASSTYSSYTRPTKPDNITATTQRTDGLRINWTSPERCVDRYIVTISNNDFSCSKNTTNITEVFFNLKPGRIYNITVTAVAGHFTNDSDLVSFATTPTPPGPIIISRRTNSSLFLNWSIPVSMEGAPGIRYNVTYIINDAEDQIKSNHTIIETISTELSSLLSGVLYNITVETVGPQGLSSTAVNRSAFTLPNPVLNLTARPASTASIKLEWSYPLGAQTYYRYLIKTYGAEGTAVDNMTVTNNSTYVRGLQPGTKYNISVTTIADPGSESTEEQTSSYTLPNAVKGLSVSEVNTTAIQLTWSKNDSKPSYYYHVVALQNGIEVQNNQTKEETYTFFNLIPGTKYTFNVTAVVDVAISASASISSYTKPEAVTNITATGNTTAISVSWTPAGGGVVSYSVLLYSSEELVQKETNLSNTTENIVFLGLTPGVLYYVVVSTKSGSFVTNSSRVYSATFPNPPGSITVESQTVQSINFTWALPEGMDHNQYSFKVSTINGSNLIVNNWYLLDHLQSGSPYWISVVTVGVEDHESEAVTTTNYTRPFSVTKLRETEITTNSVTLVWVQPERKSDYSYVVQVSNDSLSHDQESFNTTHTFNGLLSGSNYSFTVTTQTKDGTQASPVTISYFTRPYSVQVLEAKTLNTTSVQLTWKEPQEYKNEYTYRVHTSCDSENMTTAEDSAQISGLTPGTNCTFCVFVRAANGIEGLAKCISMYTEPEAVQPSISSQGSNRSVLVLWAKPRGKVEFYKVSLNQTLQERNLSSDNTSYLFEGLSAGTLYTVRVTTFSGPLNAPSEFITNATFPNPPGPIEVLKKETNSIEIKWERAPLMTNTSFVYKLLSNGKENTNTTITTTSTNHIFSPLLSGTSYNIIITTVGVMDFESKPVHIDTTTRPFAVVFLWAQKAEETNIKVIWSKPDEYKESYFYNLTWHSENGLNSTITSEHQFNINNLDPGSNYSYSVTTETSDGTKSTPTLNSTCTKASQVKDLSYEGPNNPNAEIILTWNKPSGQYSGFLVTGTDNIIINSTTCCSLTLSNLRHNTKYDLNMKTLSCGQSSSSVFLQAHTGITAPPIPSDSLLLSTVTKTEYNQFILRIHRSLLNDTYGPIKYVAVLVTENPPGDDLKTYLDQSYDDWKAGKTQAYLATIMEVDVPSRSTEDNLIMNVGNGSKWNGYTNGPLEAKGRYQYAIVLFTSLNLTENDLVNVPNSLVSITAFYSAFVLPQNPATISMAVGATLGIFFVLFIILIGFIIYWKRSNKETPDIQIHSMRAKVSMVVRIEDYEDYYKKQKADSNCGFAEEFEDLKPIGTAQSKNSALTLENKPKNRYNNVLPYDSSRVKLSIVHGSPFDDYINANYMPGYNSRKEFIAAQGPLPTTVNEFWRMIWEKNVQTLVMLTRCNEQGRVKCEQYWSSGTKHFENITVTTTSEIPLEDWTIRDFDIKNVKTAETRSVRQFHFTAWPDHGVPETTELLISFRHLVREHMDQYSRHSPTVVHCSAGVGRTGTFISIDRMLFQIERDNVVDVFGIVYDLRMHRPLMVQTEDQYVFLNQCAMDIIRSRNGTNVDLIYQNTAALSIYENVEPKKGFRKNGYHNA